jgi:hypothetical protein
MALEGTLRDFSFADILQLISLQRKTGVLTLKSDDNVVTISFLNGRLVGASSLNQHTEDRLGLILLKRGEITDAELEAALRRQEETLQRLGRILIDHEVVPNTSVREALEQQILQIVFRVFRWADGEYHFSQETDIDYDRDLMVPMVADSIIMEGARMTDEWPFVDQHIPDRNVVFVKSDPDRRFEVADEPDADLDELAFSFTDLPEDSGMLSLPDDRMSSNQHTVYAFVNGRETVHELILRSPLMEFETCKALAELVERGLIRVARPDEVAFHMSGELVTDQSSRRSLAGLPWLAIPFLILLGFSVSVMSRNSLNPSFALGSLIRDRFVLESASWFRTQSLAVAAERDYLLTGVYPEIVTAIVDNGLAGFRRLAVDPWGRPYRMVTRGQKLIVTGANAAGQPVPLLLISKPLAWDGGVEAQERSDEPGVILIQ